MYAITWCIRTTRAPSFLKRTVKHQVAAEPGISTFATSSLQIKLPRRKSQSNGAHTFFAADQHQKRISEPALRRPLVFGYWLSRYALTFSKYSVGGVSTAICCWAGRRSSLGDRKRRVHSHNLRVKNYFVIVKCD